MENKLNIDYLIETVTKGGVVKTGVDCYSQEGILLLQKDVIIMDVKPLIVLKKKGIDEIPYDQDAGGGIWDRNGQPVLMELEIQEELEKISQAELTPLQKRIEEIISLKSEASQKYASAKKSITKAITEIRDSGGQFEYDTIKQTVSELQRFLSKNKGGFSFLTKEIFSYDDYLYNHSINVCTIGTAVLTEFNDNFSASIDTYLNNLSFSDEMQRKKTGRSKFRYYMVDEIADIATGFILHDVGKIFVPDDILNKNGKLSSDEFNKVKRHSFEIGSEIMKANKINNPYISNVIRYHHSALFPSEQNCYPEYKPPEEIPPYVKAAKLSDIYDAMTSKKSYDEAYNPITAVTDIFRKYAQKDRVLQLLLHSFVRAVGIYPPGSIVHLRNHQLAYIIDADGPIVLPFTDSQGKPLMQPPEPVDLGKEEPDKSPFQIDRRAPLVTPKKAYDAMPPFLKGSVFADSRLFSFAQYTTDL